MTDDASFATRLKNEQIKVINQSTSQIEKWENLQKEYQTLKDKLSTVPEKVEHKMMIPIGSVGFFPGKLIHTNEIMVLLGDNWFVQRSAHQASEIAGRRLAILNERLEDAKQQVNFLESQKKLTEDISAEKQNDGIVEIKEEEKTATVAKSERRIAHVSSHNLTPRTVPKFVDDKTTKLLASQNASAIHNDADVDRLFARLEELEQEERLLESKSEEAKSEHHVADGLVNGGEIGGISRVEEKQRSHVHFEHVVDSGIRQVAENQNDLDSNETNCIRFYHTEKSKIENSFLSSSEESNGINKQIFKSPADIYDHFIKPAEAETEEKPLKSILKKERKFSNEGLKPKPILKHSPEHKAESPSIDDVNTQYVDEPKPILKSGPEAVSSVVLEKQINATDPGFVEAPQKKPVSRFKASRMKKT